jgi:hypothetical protein
MAAQIIGIFGILASGLGAREGTAKSKFDRSRTFVLDASSTVRVKNETKVFEYPSAAISRSCKSDGFHTILYFTNALDKYVNLR